MADPSLLARAKSRRLGNKGIGELRLPASEAQMGLDDWLKDPAAREIPSPGFIEDEECCPDWKVGIER